MRSTVGGGDDLCPFAVIESRTIATRAVGLK